MIFNDVKSQVIITGRVIDQQNGQPAPFLNVFIQSTKMGSRTDIEGQFRIKNVVESDVIMVTGIGYESLEIPAFDLIKKNQPVEIKIKSKIYLLKEAIILPGFNPAHRIIKNVLNNKKINNYERLPHFEVKLYNKFIVTREPTDSLDRVSIKREKEYQEKNKNSRTISINLGKKDKKNPKDSTYKPPRKRTEKEKQQSEDSFFNKQHIFLSESIIDKKYKYPDKLSQTILANRTSGTKDPIFSLLSTELSDFNVYSDFISSGGIKYLSPIAYGSIPKYLFILEDSFKQGNDSVYVISFRPRKGKLFNGMLGVMHVNNHHWGIQSISARPIEQNGGLNTEISEEFVLQENDKWFPEKINYKMVLSQFMSDSAALIGRGRTVTLKKDFVTELKNKEFNSIETQTAPDVMDKSEVFWKENRPDTLSSKDSVTYHVIDSLGKAFKIDKKLKFAKALVTGRLPIKKVDILLDKIIEYNGFEEFRLGIGLASNQKWSQFYELGGYYAYGFKDEKSKYSGYVNITPFKDNRLIIIPFYEKDVLNLGGDYYVYPRKTLSAESNNNIYRTQMYYYEKLGLGITFNPLRYTKAKAIIYNDAEYIPSNYLFRTDRNHFISSFNSTQLDFGIRYALKEKSIVTPGFIMVNPAKYPVLNLSFSGPLSNNWDGKQFSYIRIQATIDFNFDIKLIGNSSLCLKLGQVLGAPPINKLFSSGGNSSNGKDKYFGIQSQNVFETMPMYRFWSDHTINFFYTHNFEEFLIQRGNWKPILQIHQNMGIGWLKSQNNINQINKNISDFRKGYYESGVSLNRLYGNLGFAVFYRYGPYQDVKTENNFYFKLAFIASIPSSVFSTK